ncbi:MAG TPA: porin family protein [Candidatus Kapabacteria bacterium]|nr:porin family protein [Candidatus Kapabacteria bacterium]
MKHYLLALAFGLVALLVPAIIRAQQMMIGVRGGVNLANQEFSLGTGDTATIKPGLIAGGELDYWLDSTWGLCLQALFDQKGAKSEKPMNPPFFYGIYIPAPSYWTRNYIELPLFVKARFGIASWHPYIFAGPSIGLLLSNTEEFDYPTAHSYNITDSTKNIDFSVVAGAGIALTLPSDLQLFVDASYAYGLTNSDNYYYDKSNGFNVYSRDIRLAAGILFPIH